MYKSLYPWQGRLLGELSKMRDRLPNGAIVYGPRGIGTFEIVEEFAKGLLCEAPNPDGSPCGKCAGCLLARAGNHPDMRYVLSEAEALPRGLPYEPPSASGTRKNLIRDILIHQPRALADFLSLAPHRSRVRVVLVYPADRIRPDAASVFLKMLEEPPEGVVFLMVAEDIDAVLPTIRSRSRLIRATPPSREESVAWLRGKGVKDPEEALLRAGGMPVSVFETDPGRELSEEDLEALLSLLSLSGDPGDYPRRVVAEVKKEWPLGAVAVALERWGWDLAAVSRGRPPRYFPREKAVLAKLASKLRRDPFFSWQKEVLALRAVSDHPLNAKLAAEQILLSYPRSFGL